MILTDSLDDICQQNPITDVCLKIGDVPFVTGFFQVVIGPICVDLKRDGNKKWSTDATQKYFSEKALHENLRFSLKDDGCI